MFPDDKIRSDRKDNTAGPHTGIGDSCPKTSLAPTVHIGREDIAEVLEEPIGLQLSPGQAIPGAALS